MGYLVSELDVKEFMHNEIDRWSRNGVVLDVDGELKLFNVEKESIAEGVPGIILYDSITNSFEALIDDLFGLVEPMSKLEDFNKMRTYFYREVFKGYKNSKFVRIN